jgi:hypothetical protein
MADLHMLFPRHVVALDHLRQVLTVVTYVVITATESATLDQAYDTAVDAIDAVLAVGKLHACAHALAGRREGELLAAILRMYVHVYLYLYGHDNNIAGTFRRADALLQGSSGEGANDWQRT